MINKQNKTKQQQHTIRKTVLSNCRQKEVARQTVRLSLLLILHIYNASYLISTMCLIRQIITSKYHHIDRPFNVMLPHYKCMEIFYSWRKLPQVSFLSRQNFAASRQTCIVMTKHAFCRDKSMLVATNIFFLSRQNFYRDKCLSRQTQASFGTRIIFVTTKVLS